MLSGGGVNIHIIHKDGECGCCNHRHQLEFEQEGI